MSHITHRMSLKELKDMSNSFSTTKARDFATAHNISPNAITGTGKNNKIKMSDLKAHIAPKKGAVELPSYGKAMPKVITMISDLSCKIRKRFPYGGAESHFQGALEGELQEMGHMVQHEVAAQIHYKKLGGETMCLPHDVRCREDLVLPREKLVLELKAKAKLDDKDHCQLIRYMEERNKYSDWGAHTRGMLINFGDHGIEVWYLCYKGSVVQRVKLVEEAMPELDSIVESFVG